jgi:hypothetical protein
MVPQTISFEEYEAALAAKKAALNKPKAEIKVDLDTFKGMVTYVRKDTSEVVTGVELTTGKKVAETAEDKADKAKKTVSAPRLASGMQQVGKGGGSPCYHH